MAMIYRYISVIIIRDMIKLLNSIDLRINHIQIMRQKL